MMGSRSLSDDLPNGGEDPVEVGLNLAHRPDLQVGSTYVRPSLRTIEGREGSATVEPRVMHVLLALIDADGAVRTREDLMQACWKGVTVGDDSVNRAIAEARRAVRVAGAALTIETIPRVGYRLIVEKSVGLSGVETSATAPDLSSTDQGRLFTRRQLLIGSLTVAGAVGAGYWLISRESADSRVADLIERGRDALRDSIPARDSEAVRLFREATTLAPAEAEPWGWLALALRRIANRAGPDKAEAAFRQSEEATKRALEIDPREPNARVAWAQAHDQLDDRIAVEDRLREILSEAPDNVAALTLLTSFLQAVGRCRESWDVNERVLALEPLAVIHQQRRALKHWIFARPTQADQVVDGALRRWPRHPLLWQARLHIYAFTGRTRAALALIDDTETRPPEETTEQLDIWRASLKAMETRAPVDVEVARAVNVAGATLAPGAAANAIMILSALGEVDSAYAVAEGLLLRRGPIVGRPAGASGPALAQNPRWNQTQWLFIPATTSLRADPRFGAFCREIGLSSYWQRRGVGPDF